MAQPKDQAHSWRDGDGAFVRTHLAVVPMPEPEESISRVKALPWGEVELRDGKVREMFDEPGTLLVDERTASAVPANFESRDIDYFVNLGHNGYGAAYGWIEGVDVVAGEGIYLTVNWTGEGEKLIRDKAYRYSSIEVILDASSWFLDGSPAQVVAVTGLALTNYPAVVGQAPVAYETLNAALSSSDGREMGKAQAHPPDDSGEKGECRMDGNFLTGLLSPIFGREPKDEVDAAKLAAEVQTIREGYAEVLTERDEARSKVTELTEQLEKATKTISEYKAQEAERVKAELAARVETAIKEGRIALSQAELAKAEPELFLQVAEKTKAGTFSPPEGRQVQDGAIARAEAELGAPLDSSALKAETEAYMAEHDVPYHEAARVVNKLHASAGKGV